MKWCIHMDSTKFDTSLIKAIFDEFVKFCPVCRAKRPQDKKALWEKMQKDGWDLNNSMSMELANIAIDAVLEVANKITLFDIKKSRQQTASEFLNELKIKLEEMRGE